jgi:hypothetical protein
MNYIISETSVPNFIDENEIVNLVTCPVCRKNNQDKNIRTGICIFCGFDLNEHKIINYTNDLLEDEIFKK